MEWELCREKRQSHTSNSHTTQYFYSGWALGPTSTFKDHHWAIKFYLDWSAITIKVKIQNLLIAYECSTLGVSGEC